MTTIAVTITEPVIQVTPAPFGDAVSVAVSLTENSITVTPDVTENQYLIQVQPAPDVSMTVQLEEPAIGVSVTLEEVTVVIEVTETPSTPSGPGTYTLRWIDFATGFATTPTLEGSIATGQVWRYTYGADVRYRFIATDGSLDAFYTTYTGTAVSGLLAAKQIDL